MPRLNQNQRIQALTMLARGDISNVSRAFGCHRNTIIRLRKRFQQTGGVADRRRPGRPRVTNPRTNRFITLTHLFKRRQVLQGSAVSANSVKPPQASPATHSAKEALCGTSAYSTSSGCPFAVGTTAFPLGGATAVGSDESKFNLSHHNGRIRVFRRRGERFADNCLIERDRFGGGSVMVWGGIMGSRKTNLIVVQGNLNAQGYINQILQPEAVPFLRRRGPAVMMHDNARPHVAMICRQLLNRNNVNVLPWPAVSPDMNPIEHIWDYLGRKVRARGNIHNLRDLENALIQEWNIIPNVVIRRYVMSMPGRLAACINSRGGHTRY